MKQFPDESKMERGVTDNEPIRGGSIAINSILGLFVKRSTHDHTPVFKAVLVSAYTLFTNVFSQNPSMSMEEVEKAFVHELVIFLEYYDTYLSYVRSHQNDNRKCIVYVYFPNYRHLPVDMRREHKGRQLELITAYTKFLQRHSGQDELVKVYDNLECYWGPVGNHDYPHRELVGKFHKVTHRPNSLYHTGDPVAIITHVPLDLHVASRLRGIMLLERFTAKLKSPNTFGTKIDKEGRLPFYGITHGMFGDGVLIKPQITTKLRKQAFEQAEKEKWSSRSESDIKDKLSRLLKVPVASLRKYDFS